MEIKYCEKLMYFIHDLFGSNSENPHVYIFMTNIDFFQSYVSMHTDINVKPLAIYTNHQWGIHVPSVARDPSQTWE